jgi:YVTN family beta-propeller protein
MWRWSLQHRFGDRDRDQHGGRDDPSGDLNSNTVSVIATATNTVVATIPMGVGPSRVAITPDGAFAYVVNGLTANTVSVIATATNTVVATIPVGVGPSGVAIT